MSDLHTEVYKFKYERLDEDVLVLAGDIGVGHQCIDFLNSLPKDLPIVFVAGNHEFYKQHKSNMEMWFAKELNNNIHWLNNSEWIFNGVRFLGGTMWSDFGLFGEAERWFVEDASKRGIADFHIIKNGNDRLFTIADCKHEFAQFDKFMRFALKQPFQGKTVVVSHHCPSLQSVHPRFLKSSITPYFASNCEHLMGWGASLFIHGHTHDSYDYNIEGTRVLCNPLGYGGLSGENKGGFNPNLIVEI